MSPPRKKKPPARSAPNPRDRMIVELRERGYTYEAIAHELHKAGLTAHEVSRVRMSVFMRRLAPHLTGSIKHRKRLDKLVHKKDIVEGGADAPVG